LVRGKRKDVGSGKNLLSPHHLTCIHLLNSGIFPRELQLLDHKKVMDQQHPSETDPAKTTIAFERKNKNKETHLSERVTPDRNM